MIGFSFTKGTQILVAKRVGAKQDKEVGEIIDHTIVLLGVLAVVILLFLLLASNFVLSYLLESQEILKFSKAYLDLRAPGILFSFMGSVLIALFSGIGRTGILGLVLVLMSVVNIGFNYLLVFGMYGFPEMGIAGAGLASLIAEVTALVLLLSASLKKKYRIKYALFKFKKIRGVLMREMTSISLPLVGQQLIGLSAWFTFFTLIEKMGEKELAVSNIVKMIYMFCGISTYGFASATNTIVGNLWGQRNIGEIYPALFRLGVMSTAFAAVMAGFIALFPQESLYLFSNDESAKTMAGPLVYVVAVALIIYSGATIIFNGIISIGSTKISLLVEIAAIVIYMGYLWLTFFRLQSGLEVLWASEWLYWLIIGSLSLLYLRFSGWQKKI